MDGASSERKTMRPSEVFARRLRETRKSRGLTQEGLAEALALHKVPLSKTALVGIEGADQHEAERATTRRLALDEALGIAAVLNAAPANMLTPSEGVMIQITGKMAIDAVGFRDFLRFGLWGLDALPPEYLPEFERDKFERQLASLALGLADAYRGEDQAGITDAVRAIIDAVKLRYLDEMTRGPG